MVHDDDMDDKPFEIEANHPANDMVIPQLRLGIFELADAENVFDGSSQCEPLHSVRVAIQLTQKSEQRGGHFSIRFLFPKCKQRLGADFTFKPFYPYDHKPVLEAFIDENLAVYKKPCAPEDVYIPGTKEDELGEGSQKSKEGSHKSDVVEDNQSVHEQTAERRRKKRKRRLIEL